MSAVRQTIRSNEDQAPAFYINPLNSAVSMHAQQSLYHYPWLRLLPDTMSSSFEIPLTFLGQDSINRHQVTGAPKNDHLLPGDALRLTQADGLIFGSIELNAENIAAATHEAYSTVLEALKQHQSYRLIRIWHYLPDINVEEKGMERYRQFSRARYEVMSSYGFRMAEDLPAASAVGSHGKTLVIHFIAGTGAIRTIENPRQISAYRYPDIYGPRSPSFSRALSHKISEEDHLFISGTASIVGHATIAPSDPEGQTEVTLDNLSALLSAEGYRSLEQLGVNAHWSIYIRNRMDIDRIHSIVQARINPESTVCYLEGDICRRDLMLEIEGYVINPS
jgi:chorismate lyase / 3-hydroxybenzoate synthase